MCEEIRKMRASTGLSQSKYAAYFDIPVSTLQDWEQGRRKPPVYVVSMMKKILELEHLKSFVLTGNDAERILQQIRPRSEEAEEGLKELKKRYDKYFKNEK